MATIGLLHPGQMGASVGSALRGLGHSVLWCPEGRSADSRSRAEEAGLEQCQDLKEMARLSDMIVSVCPPDRAVDVATEVGATGFGAIFVDANAVSPATADLVKDTLAGSGATVVDGGLIGPPPWTAGTTRMYVAGDDPGHGARTVVSAFDGSPLDVIELESGYGSASALKMAYAGWTKGSSALALSIVAFASASGVSDALFSEWNLSQPEMVATARGAARGTAPKAWRFVGEMLEISNSLADCGLPSGFHAAAAEAYASLAGFKGSGGEVDLDAVVEALLGRADTRTEPSP